MNNKSPEHQADTNDVLPEYDFSEGVRGKHHEAYQRGYQITIHKTDGTTEVRDCALPEGTVILDPDVREYFSDSESVNRTLRELINLVPQRQRSGKAE